MKQSLKFSFLLFVLAVFVLAAVYFGSPRATLAQDGYPPVGDPGTPTSDETPIPNEGTNPANENVIQEEDTPVDPIGGLEQKIKDSSQQIVVAPQLTEAKVDGFLYAYLAIDTLNAAIYGYKVDAVTGGLSLLDGFPVASGGESEDAQISESLVYDSTNGRLFALNRGATKTVSVFNVNNVTGALTPLTYSPFDLPLSGDYWCLAVHPSGSPLVAASTDDGQVVSYNITSSSATAAAGSPYDSDSNAFSCEFSQSGQYVYIGTSSVKGYSVNQSTGVLTALAGSPFAAGSTPIAYATDEEGRLFLSNISAGTVRAFTTDNGIPTERSNIASVLTSAVDGIVHAAGFYIVADRIGNRVGVYKINGSGSSTSLLAVAGQPFASGGLWTDTLALSRTGAYLYAGNGDSRNITSYRVNVSTGALSNIGTLAANALGSSGRITGMAFAPIETAASNAGEFF